VQVGRVTLFPFYLIVSLERIANPIFAGHTASFTELENNSASQK